MSVGVYKPRILYTKLRAISIDQPVLRKSRRPTGRSRDCDKVMRCLEKEDTPILAGYQIFRNYIRPHMALDGETPATRAGIEVKGENKWLTIIQNATDSANHNA